MRKTDREKIFNKYGGRCAYCGCVLQQDWQVDHKTPVYWFRMMNKEGVNADENLLPSDKKVNHYKRGSDASLFRKTLSTLHLRVAKLPKNPYTEKGIKRKKYLLDIADKFGITADKPFSGIFYFETHSRKSNHG